MVSFMVMHLDLDQVFYKGVRQTLWDNFDMRPSCDPVFVLSLDAMVLVGLDDTPFSIVEV